MTGEIKGLDRSYLTVRTIELGTVQIRWQRVVRLNSNRMLEIVLADRGRIIGAAHRSQLRNASAVARPNGSAYLRVVVNR